MSVYFIKPIGMDGPVKIGCSWSPDRRLKTLETWSPFPLEVVAMLDGGLYMERRFHALFVDDHIHHEWFRYTDALGAVIDAIKSGTFSHSVLPDAAQLPRRKKDLSYLTPEWRAKRSRDARIQAQMRRDRDVKRAVAHDRPETQVAA